MEKIKVKYHCDDIEKIKKITIGDWIDLRAAENVILFPGQFKKISLGVSMKLPEGYEAHIVPRSSTFDKWGIIQTNHMAVIDNSYSGTNDVWKLPIYCLKGSDVVLQNGDYLHNVCVISKGDRICQFRIMKTQPEIEFEEVEVLDETDRGGFGSSGTN